MIDILGILGSGALGSAVGIFGNFIKGRGERKAQNDANAHELETRKLDLVELREEAKLANIRIQIENDGKQALAETESQRALDVMEGEIRKASYANDKASYGGGFVDTIRGLMRPLLTLMFVIITAYYGYQVHVMVNGLDSLASLEVFDLYREVINTIMFLTTSSVTWWFGSRSTVKR